ncbi:Beta-glucuronidase [Nymphon striatum]|nr:Beta-glucuronidase [Nymphon striatum]
MHVQETGDVIPMPVPSSYNDVTLDRNIRDHLGWVWYDRQFIPPNHWHEEESRVVLRFGSVHYTAMVFVNGISVANHSGGHLPFEAEISKHLLWKTDNLITVAVNNTLTKDTVPQGQTIYEHDLSMYPPGYHVQKIPFDFFNYAGIHRPVTLSTTPKIYIDDITIKTGIVGQTTGKRYRYRNIFSFLEKLLEESITCLVYLRDASGNIVSKSNGCTSNLVIHNASLWWPFTMHKNPAYLYELEVNLLSSSTSDVYKLPVGIRTVSWTNSSLFINNKPFYFTGFGRHEDSDIRGKGMDFPLIIRDFNLIKFLGANSFRTSHYPYADEIMDQADRQGIVIIEETPAVSLHSFGAGVLKQHLQTIREMIARDKNRPSVVMWSMANEPRSALPKVFAEARSLDKTRPITAVLNAPVAHDKAGEFADIICVNRYFAWYSDTGHTELIQRQVEHEYTAWNKKYGKPVLISEYGAGSVAGLHKSPSVDFTEDYQAELILQHHMAFDNLRKKGFFIGELIWNFADFMTTQGVNRVDGNKKGILTRNRQPKMSAYVIRKRYYTVAKENYNYTMPKDEKKFQEYHVHNEL